MFPTQSTHTNGQPMNLNIAFAIPLLLVLAACSKLSQENYSKIATGMRYDEVVSLIGKPDRCDDILTAKTCTWGNAEHSATVSFLADKVILFSATNLK